VGSNQQADWVDWLLRKTGAQAITEINRVQQLWGGYGELLRVGLSGSPGPTSVILKRVVPPGQTIYGSSGLPGQTNHQSCLPRSRESSSDQRKSRSYEVEQAWYQGEALKCKDCCRLAQCYAADTVGDARLLLLEDLFEAGFRPVRPPGMQEIRGGLGWLARFHARFLGARPEGLWQQGNYWHLDTRQEEYRRMPEGPLKQLAVQLDRRLKEAHYQTLLHGDAKPANFCWDATGTAAAVDFQYVGPGCGIQDVAYFLDCCLDEPGCEVAAAQWLDFYFSQLREALDLNGHGSVVSSLEQEWRGLYPVAWSDYGRFYQGWAPGGVLGGYSQMQLSRAQAAVTQGI